MTSVTDFTQYATLRADARSDEQATLREVAEQFESIFIQQMLKSMRDASFGDPYFPEEGAHGLYRDLFDQQVSSDMASQGGVGLADMIVRQLSRPAQSLVAPVVESVSNVPAWSTPKDFVAEVLPHARRAAAALNVSPLAIVAQAALETGWGTRVPENDAQKSWNLFGIKANRHWSGDSVQTGTLEFRDGQAQREQASFRAYGSLRDTFDDYVALLGGSERYREARGAGSDVSQFAEGLQAGGYATDPEYAGKLERVAGSDTMRAVLSELKESDLLTLAEQQDRAAE